MDLKVIEFKTEYTADKATDWVLVAPRGETMEQVQTWHRIRDIQPSADDAGDRAVALNGKWSVIGPLYEAWKRDNIIPDFGTPLAAWPGVTADQAAHLKRMGLTTVEHVRDMPEGAILKLPFPDARKLPALAGMFLEATSVAAKDRQITEMQERMDAMEAMLLEGGGEPKRGPGRPRKQEAEAA